MSRVFLPGARCSKSPSVISGVAALVPPQVNVVSSSVVEVLASTATPALSVVAVARPASASAC
jgi:hypothetical protein